MDRASLRLKVLGFYKHPINTKNHGHFPHKNLEYGYLLRLEERSKIMHCFFYLSLLSFDLYLFIFFDFQIVGRLAGDGSNSMV